MKVAIDISPIKTGHSIRGIGSYTKNLIEEFKNAKDHDIVFKFFDNPHTPPPASVIHYPYFDLFFHTLPIKKTASRVVTIHDVIPIVFPKHFPKGFKGTYNLFLQKLALKNADAIICDSIASKEDVVKYLNYPQNKIYVIYLAASPIFKKTSDLKKLSEVSKKYNLPPKFVLYVGDVNWSKNIPNLLKAIANVDTTLVMVGKALTDNNLAEVKEINSLIKALHLDAKIIKTGYVEDDDLVAIYNLASLTVLPSFYEGFGLPVLESMACGTPMVISRAASLEEIGGKVAIYCKPDDVLGIASKIEKALKLNEEERRSLSEKLMNHASKFSWQKVARQTLNVYKTAIQNI